MQYGNVVPKRSGPSLVKLVTVMVLSVGLSVFLWAQVIGLMKEGQRALPLMVFTTILAAIAFGTFFGTFLMICARYQRRSRAT